MNKRIQELIEQCSEYSDMHQGVWFDKEKFAELIVKECAKMAGEQEFGDVWEGPVEDKIKKHFGVE